MRKIRVIEKRNALGDRKWVVQEFNNRQRDQCWDDLKNSEHEDRSKAIAQAENLMRSEWTSSFNADVVWDSEEELKKIQDGSRS